MVKEKWETRGNKEDFRHLKFFTKLHTVRPRSLAHFYKATGNMRIGGLNITESYAPTHLYPLNLAYLGEGKE